jgi:hypothetical protein
VRGSSSSSRSSYPIWEARSSSLVRSHEPLVHVTALSPLPHWTEGKSRDGFVFCFSLSLIPSQMSPVSVSRSVSQLASHLVRLNTISSFCCGNESPSPNAYRAHNTRNLQTCTSIAFGFSVVMSGTGRITNHGRQRDRMRDKRGIEEGIGGLGSQRCVSDGSDGGC